VPTSNAMASTICECYRTPLLDGNSCPVEITGGQNFGERQRSKIAAFVVRIIAGNNKP
jgi:hypothetical protein